MLENLGGIVKFNEYATYRVYQVQVHLNALLTYKWKRQQECSSEMKDIIVRNVKRSEHNRMRMWGKRRT